MKVRQFYAILDTGYVSPANYYSVCAQLLASDADYIQLRAKKQNHEERCSIVESILPLFDARNTPLIINDDIELANKFPSIGIHLGQDDTPIDQAREMLGPDRIIGLSTHSLEQAKLAIRNQFLINYFAVGPVFPTQTKPDYLPVGLELVTHVANIDPPLPWFCIGGINRSNVQQVIKAGAPAVVAVSDLLTANDISAAVQVFTS